MAHKFRGSESGSKTGAAPVERHCGASGAHKEWDASTLKIAFQLSRIQESWKSGNCPRGRYRTPTFKGGATIDVYLQHHKSAQEGRTHDHRRAQAARCSSAGGFDLGVKPTKGWGLIKQKKLETIHIGPRCLIIVASIERLLEELREGELARSPRKGLEQATAQGALRWHRARRVARGRQPHIAADKNGRCPVRGHQAGFWDAQKGGERNPRVSARMGNTFRGPTRQLYQPAKNAFLDRALRTMFPPAYRTMRAFSFASRCNAGAERHRYLGSARDWRDDIEFCAEIFAIRTGYRSCPDAWLGVMSIGLKRELDAAATSKSPLCPHRHTCALLDLLKKLFGDVPLDDGARQPQESGTGHHPACKGPA